MSKVRICTNKGTAFTESEASHNRWFGNTKDLKSLVSKENQGMRVSASKGTSSLWIEKTPRIEMRNPKVIVHSRGTQRLFL
ncbi:MAG: hypothetical protein EA446_01000 [Nitrosopumilus sp.]|nr:MAG: hypothetical protein EA446_01000 [Nitrosopumilus sp.]